MDAGKKYITEVSQKDLAELAALTKLTSGAGIIITKSDQEIKVEVDKQLLRMWRINGEI